VQAVVKRLAIAAVYGTVYALAWALITVFLPLRFIDPVVVGLTFGFGTWTGLSWEAS
jgi:hypothetical protein